MNEILLPAHEILCAVLFYSVFIRAVRSCEKVRTDVRLAFFALGIVACAGMVAPLAWGFIPDGFTLSLLTAVAIVEIVTSHHWERGVPDRFYKPGHAQRQRRASDRNEGGHHAGA